jgi:hypothetical protein
MTSERSSKRKAPQQQQQQQQHGKKPAAKKMKKNDDSEQESEQEFRTQRSPGRGDFMGGAWVFCRELGKYWATVGNL